MNPAVKIEVEHTKRRGRNRGVNGADNEDVDGRFATASCH